MKASGGYNPVTESASGSVNYSRTDYQESRKNTVLFAGIAIAVIAFAALIVYYLWKNTVGVLADPVSAAGKAVGDAGKAVTDALGGAAKAVTDTLGGAAAGTQDALGAVGSAVGSVGAKAGITPNPGTPDGADLVIGYDPLCPVKKLAGVSCGDTSTLNANVVGMFNGTPVVKQNDGTYTVTPVGTITQVFCESDPAIQNKKAQELVDKMNTGLSVTVDEAAWARKCEPALYNLMGSDLKNQVVKAYGN